MAIIWDSNYPLPDQQYNWVEFRDQAAIDADYSLFTQDIHVVLDTWFEGLEGYGANELSGWIPWGSYPKTWTDEQLDELVKAIDTYVENQRNWSTRERGIAYDAGPGFERLPPAQRLALAQDLDRICQRHGKATGPDSEMLSTTAPTPVDPHPIEGGD